MDNETGAQATAFHSLIPLADFKALLGIDDRDDVMGRYCLLTASYTIEQYCKRRLVKRVSHEQLVVSNGDLLLPLREYPVREVLGVWGIGSREHE